MDVNREIIEHYTVRDESSRITNGFDRLELLRVQEIVRRHLPPESRRIADIGGGPGVHAEWLAADGHNVHIFDVVPKHIESAKQLADYPARISASYGESRSLPVADGSFDVGLVFGPIYHLTDSADRIAALTEAARVVRPGGLVFAIAISRFASLFDGLAYEYLFEDGYQEIVSADLRTGQHRNRTRRSGWFTISYFHRPDEFGRECMDSGLEIVEFVSVEGMAGWMPHLADRWQSAEGREIILQTARATEAEPALRGLGIHLMAVCRRPV